jgi:hypothetical protein
MAQLAFEFVDLGADGLHGHAHAFSGSRDAAYRPLTLNPWMTPMQVLFCSRDADASDLRDLAERRVRFVMRRLHWLVPRASVLLSDVNGPRGGVDKRCQLMLRTDGHGTIVVTAIARDWRTALDNALSRGARVLLRLWRRGRSPRATGRPMMALES